MSNQEQQNMRGKISSSLFWAFLERGGSQVISLVINVILARLLDPTHYGVVAIITIFTSLANNFVLSGFGTSLIQNKGVTDVDYSSVFYVSFMAVILLYGVLYMSAPLIAHFYKMDGLVMPLRVMSLVLFPAIWQSIQAAKCMREMKFKKLFMSSIVATLLSGIVGIAMALNGLGVWALVGQVLIASIAACVVMWFTVDWRPQAVLNWSRVRVLFAYGWKLLAASMLETLYNNLNGLVIGRKYTVDMLAFYSKGQLYPQKLIVSINDAIQSVMLPAISAEQDNKEICKAMMRRSVMTSCFVIFPLMAGLAAVAKPMVLLLLTEKWLPCVPFMQLACINFAFYPIQTANLQAMKAMGRSDMFLKLEVIKKVIGIITLAIAVFCFDSVMAIVLSTTITIPIGLFINTYPNKKIMGYAFSEQIKDMLPPLLLSCVMLCAVYAVRLIGWGSMLTLTVQIMLGVAIYIGMASLLKLESYIYLLEVTRQILRKSKKGGRK